MRNGQRGVAWLAHKYVTNHLPNEKKKYEIVDKNRKHGVYKEKNNENVVELVYDNYMANLTLKICPSIKHKANRLAGETNGAIFSDPELLKGYEEVIRMEDENGKFCTEYIKLSTVI